MGVSHYRERTLSVIIAGGGRVGRETAALMTSYGHQVTIIEQDPRITRVHSGWQEDITFVQGDATAEDTLTSVGVRKADIIFALTDDEATNVDICQKATEFVPDARRVARSHRPPAGSGNPDDVDAFVFPERAGARVAVGRAFGAPVQPITDLSTRFELVEIEAERGAPAVGQSLAELDLPTKATVITDLATEDLADGDMVIEPGCQYMIATRPGAVDDLKRLFWSSP
ncbi:MAG: TrkA family potassium uptake protein [Salinibacter sp.]|uniref:potassium channel family protein n=1 Tax=Salinibacter sp. TaxID=2065818 RepID=UPI002FC3A1BC